MKNGSGGECFYRLSAIKEQEKLYWEWHENNLWYIGKKFLGNICVPENGKYYKFSTIIHISHKISLNGIRIFHEIKYTQNFTKATNAIIIFWLLTLNLIWINARNIVFKLAIIISQIW